MNNIIHVITTIENGGAEKQLFILASQQVHLGNNVQVIYLKGKPDLQDSMISRGINVYSNIANLNFFSQVIILKKYLKKQVEPNTVLHAHLPRSEVICVLSKFNHKLFITRHNSEPFFPKAPRILSRLLSRFILDKSQVCISISDAVKRFLIDKKEISKKVPIEIVHYGYMPNHLQNRPKTKQITSTKLIVGTISRLEKQKDIPTLLKAVSLCKESGMNIELRICGSGSMKDSLSNLSKKFNIHHNVNWIGKIEDIYSFLNSIDIFILSTKYEGFGLVLLEAMQSKLPIIASNNSAIPEVLGRDDLMLFETGNIQQLANRIIFLNDKFMRVSIGRLQSKRLNLFDPEKMARQILRIYSDYVT